MDLNNFVDANLDALLTLLVDRNLITIKKSKPFRERHPERDKAIKKKSYDAHIEVRREYQRNYDREKRKRLKEQKLLEDNLTTLTP